MSELKIACASCGGHIEFPSGMAGQVIPCPHCTLSVALNIPGQSPHSPPIKPTIGRKKDAGFGFLGLIMLLVGIGLLLTLSGLSFLGLLLLFISVPVSGRRYCSECGTTIHYQSKLCPGCQCSFKS